MTDPTDIPRISVSGVRTYLNCREEYRYAYADRIRPIKGTPEQDIGTAIHAGLAVWWEISGRTSGVDAAQTEAVRIGLDAYAQEMVRVLMTGYDAAWVARHPYGYAKSEVRFRALRHGYQWSGILDAHVGKTILVEHKTTSQDISPGSDYWVKLKADLQVGLYWEASRVLGLAPEHMVYDVIRRPDIRPHKATPPEKRKYTKTGALYANQRETDETPEEYGQRAAEMIAKDPDAYYQRAEIVRLEHEVERASSDLDSLARDVLRVVPGEPQPRTGVMTGACRRCAYVGPCLHGEEISPARYVKEERR